MSYIAPTDAVAAHPLGWQPPGRMPSSAAVHYARDVILLVLIVLALPWLVKHLLTDPARVLTHSAPGL